MLKREILNIRDKLYSMPRTFCTVRPISMSVSFNTSFSSFYTYFVHDFMTNEIKGHQYKLFKKHNASRLRAAFFTERIINTWNSLPESVVDFSSLPRFRRSIQKVDFCSTVSQKNHQFTVLTK